MTRAFAHMPFLPQSSLTAGSFFGAPTEDGFMELVWRARRFEFGTDPNVDLVWHGASDSRIIYTRGLLGSVWSGENLGSGTQFSGPDDILTAWRRTEISRTGSTTGTVVLGADVSLFWGPSGTYSTDDVSLGGTLDSELLLTYSPFGDVFHYLGTQYGRQVSATEYLTAPRAILRFGRQEATITLYGEAPESGPPDEETTGVTGHLVLRPVPPFWPYAIDGAPTWDVFTGEQVASPLRRRASDNSALAYLAQIP